MTKTFKSIIAIDYDKEMVGFCLFDYDKRELIVGQDLPDTLDSDVIRSFTFRLGADLILLSTKIGSKRYESIKNMAMNIQVVPKNYFGNLTVGQEFKQQRRISLTALKCLLHFIEAEFVEYVDLSRQKMSFYALNSSVDEKEKVIGRYDNIKVKLYFDRDFLFMDPLTVSSLDLYSIRIHPNSAIRGHVEQNSLFSFLNNCQTSSGSQKLRQWLLFPSNDLKIIKKRHQQIKHLIKNDLISTLKQMLTKIKRVPPFDSFGGVRLIASHFVKIYEFICTSRKILLLFENFEEEVELVDLKGKIKHCYMKQTRSDSVVCQGYDSELDQLIAVKKQLPQYLDEVALKSCSKYHIDASIVYYPQLGYLIETHSAVSELDLVFAVDNLNYYKDDFMRRLDESLGDVVSQISEKERAVALEVARMVQKCHISLHNRHDQVSTIDCIYALAATAKAHNMIEPVFISDLSPRVTIHTYRGLDNPHFYPISLDIRKNTILSGNNTSGKSTTLVAIGQCVVMAQMGSFLPCKSVEISLFDKIYTKMGSKESLSSGKSSFVSDLIQISHAERYSTENSLFLCDEFGKGTNSYDGFSLFISAMKNIQNPLKIFTTHFYDLLSNDISEYIQNCSILTIVDYEIKTGLFYKSNVCDLLRKHGFNKDFIDLFEYEKSNNNIEKNQNIQWAKDIINNFIIKYKIDIKLKDNNNQ